MRLQVSSKSLDTDVFFSSEEEKRDVLAFSPDFTHWNYSVSELVIWGRKIAVVLQIHITFLCSFFCVLEDTNMNTCEAIFKTLK